MAEEVLLSGFLGEEIESLIKNKAPVTLDLPQGVFLGPLGGSMRAQVVFMPKAETKEERRSILDKLVACLESHEGKNVENHRRIFPSIWFDYRKNKEILVVDNPQYFPEDVKNEIASSIS